MFSDFSPLNGAIFCVLDEKREDAHDMSIRKPQCSRYERDFLPMKQ